MTLSIPPRKLRKQRTPSPAPAWLGRRPRRASSQRGNWHDEGPPVEADFRPTRRIAAPMALPGHLDCRTSTERKLPAPWAELGTARLTGAGLRAFWAFPSGPGTVSMMVWASRRNPGLAGLQPGSRPALWRSTGARGAGRGSAPSEDLALRAQPARAAAATVGVRRRRPGSVAAVRKIAFSVPVARGSSWPTLAAHTNVRQPGHRASEPA